MSFLFRLAFEPGDQRLERRRITGEEPQRAVEGDDRLGAFAQDGRIRRMSLAGGGILTVADVSVSASPGDRTITSTMARMLPLFCAEFRSAVEP